MTTPRSNISRADPPLPHRRSPLDDDIQSPWPAHADPRRTKRRETIDAASIALAGLVRQRKPDGYTEERATTTPQIGETHPMRHSVTITSGAGEPARGIPGFRPTAPRAAIDEDVYTSEEDEGTLKHNPAAPAASAVATELAQHTRVPVIRFPTAFSEAQELMASLRLVINTRRELNMGPPDFYTALLSQKGGAEICKKFLANGMAAGLPLEAGKRISNEAFLKILNGFLSKNTSLPTISAVKETLDKIEESETGLPLIYLGIIAIDTFMATRGCSMDDYVTEQQKPIIRHFFQWWPDRYQPIAKSLQHNHPECLNSWSVLKASLSEYKSIFDYHDEVAELGSTRNNSSHHGNKRETRRGGGGRAIDAKRAEAADKKAPSGAQRGMNNKRSDAKGAKSAAHDSKTDPRCYNCNETGHIKRDCPKEPKADHARGKRFHNWRQQSKGGAPHALTLSTATQHNPDAPVVNLMDGGVSKDLHRISCEIDGIGCKGVLDSAASLATLCSTTRWGDLQRKGVKQQFLGSANIKSFDGALHGADMYNTNVSFLVDGRQRKTNVVMYVSPDFRDDETVIIGQKVQDEFGISPHLRVSNA